MSTKTVMNERPQVITREFLRWRAFLALGVLILSAAVSIFLLRLGSEMSERRGASGQVIQDATLHMVQTTMILENLTVSYGGPSHPSLREDLGQLLAIVEKDSLKITGLITEKRIADETYRFLNLPGVDPIELYSELQDVAGIVSSSELRFEQEKRHVAVSLNVTRQLTATLQGMQRTERFAGEVTANEFTRFGWGAFVLTLLAAGATFFLVYMPMERAVIASQNRINKSLRAAESALDAKSRFLATMSHEIRTPLSGVLGMVELMERGQLSASQREQLRVVDDCGNALIAIIDDILDIEKIDAGKVEIKREAFDVRKACNDVLRLFSGPAEQKNVQLEIWIDPNVRRWIRLGDKRALWQILSNLISNAIKFTSDGHVLVSLNSLDAGSLIEIEVRDDGVGVTADRLPHVFNRFEQAHEDTSGKYGGTGLGLAIVQKLTQAMGGVIFAQSEVGKGTVITVRLPMAVASDIALPNEETEPHTELMRPALYQHVLIAEDNDVNRLLATRFLEDVGVKVSHAKDGLEAAEMASKLDPDLILMDSNMPGLDGLEATRHIRAQEARADRKRIPIIAFTANVIGEDRVRAQEAGMDGYVSKPFRSADLINVITTDWSEMNSPECHASS